MTPVATEDTRLIFALAIPAGTPVTLVKKIIDFSPLVADKPIQVLSK